MSGDWKAGLEDVIATRSAICAIDGAAASETALRSASRG